MTIAQHSVRHSVKLHKADAPKGTLCSTKHFPLTNIHSVDLEMLFKTIQT